MNEKTATPTAGVVWTSPISLRRWKGYRQDHNGVTAFESQLKFEAASRSELERSLSDHERQTLGHLLERGNKMEMESFLRTHGANPIFDPQAELDTKVGVAKADLVDMSLPSTASANQAILNGEVIHVLFQAGEASRFGQGPFYKLNLIQFAQSLPSGSGFDEILKTIEKKSKDCSPAVKKILIEGELGIKQPIFIRAAIRRIVQEEINQGRLTLKKSTEIYDQALKNQKILFFVSRQGGVNEAHDKNLREKFKFFGFDPENVVTIEQELVHGLNLNEKGQVSLLDEDDFTDAAGHLYALIQSSRQGDFTTYTESGRPIKPMEMDALAYLASRGGKTLSIIRINDMDRHTTEIINANAFRYARSMFEKGYANVIECVSNPEKQKGGTGTTFRDPEVHCLTETHENSFPVLSRAFELAMGKYLKENAGRHPAYNAMRQWADLAATRQVLKELGGRIVFVPREKISDGKSRFYVGVDMPMGDLSLLCSNYKSRMFQFAGPQGKELLIHDMKNQDHLNIALRTVVRQLEDPAILAAVAEVGEGQHQVFSERINETNIYGAPTPEFL